MHMIMAHAHAPALVTRAMLQKLHCELLISQWSALCFAQGNLCGCEAAGPKRDDAKDPSKGTPLAIRTAHALSPARAAILSACDACAITHVHVHMHMCMSKTLGRNRGAILGPTECLSHWQHEYASRDHTLLRGHELVRSATSSNSSS